MLLDEFEDDDARALSAALLQPMTLAAAAESRADRPIDAAQVLAERPDVMAAFYSEFYGPSNDRHSDAWVKRVGGSTVEDYARYWLKTYGPAEGYGQPPGGGLGAPVEPQARMTFDGVPIAQILADRPDVFRAFFTEYYGPNNDRHSDAWVNRVGGATVEDYADYWYRAHGRLEGYRPSTPNEPAPPQSAPDESPDAGPPAPELPPLRDEDPSLDPWNHPAIYPDWQPPYPGWQPPGSADVDAAAAPPPEPPAFFYSDPEAPMLPILPGQSLLDPSDDLF